MTSDHPGHTERTVGIPGLVLAEHEFTVPLDHAEPDGARILDRLIGLARGGVS